MTLAALNLQARYGECVRVCGESFFVVFVFRVCYLMCLLLGASLVRWDEIFLCPISTTTYYKPLHLATLMSLRALKRRHTK